MDLTNFLGICAYSCFYEKQYTCISHGSQWEKNNVTKLQRKTIALDACHQCHIVWMRLLTMLFTKTNQLSFQEVAQKSTCEIHLGRCQKLCFVSFRLKHCGEILAGSQQENIKCIMLSSFVAFLSHFRCVFFGLVAVSFPPINHDRLSNH